MIKKMKRNKNVLLAKMTRPEVEEALKRTDIALLPVGSVEQHGRHLPSETDAATAFHLAKLAAERVDAVVAPPLVFGISYHHMDFAGTLSLRPETMIEVVKDICKSLLAHGFKNAAIINGHGGNSATLSVAVTKIQEETGCMVPIISWWAFLTPEFKREILETPPFHAEETETSFMLAIEPEYVHMDQAVKEEGKPFSKFVRYDMTGMGPVGYPIPRIKDITDSGTIGDETIASKEKGERLIEWVVDHIVQVLKEMRARSKGE